MHELQRNQTTNRDLLNDYQNIIDSLKGNDGKLYNDRSLEHIFAKGHSKQFRFQKSPTTIGRGIIYDHMIICN